MSLDTATRELACLWAARERGVLDALATEAGTPDELAAASDLTATEAETFLAALASVGLVEPVGDEYEPSNRLLGFLTRTDLRSVGALPVALDTFDAWVALGDGRAPDPSAHAARNELGAQWAADEATVLETPERADAVEPLLRPTDVRLETGGPNSIPETDLLLAPGLCSRHGDADCRRWLSGARTAAPVAVDRLRDRSPDGPLHDLEAVARGVGRVRSETEVDSLFDDAGLDLSVDPVPATDLLVLAGRRVQ